MRSFAIVAVLAVSLFACRDAARAPAGTPVSAADAERILEGTPWLDSVPHDERDVIKAYVFQRGDGLWFVGNSYKASYELISYWVEDKEIKLRFLDENKTYKTTWKIERYRGEVFDYKLTLGKDPRGPKVYYGFEPSRHLPATVDKLDALVTGTAPAEPR
jgi:hypothetical protein